MAEPQRYLVGAHFRRHFGGPGHLTVAPGEIVLSDRKATRAVTQTGGSVRVQRKRLEPPTGNHWIAVTDGEVTGYATMGRKRADTILALMAECGFTIDRGDAGPAAT